MLILVISFSAFGLQDNDKKLKKKKLIEQADYYFFREDFAKALELYDKILEQYPKNHYTQYHQYVAYHLTVGRNEPLDNLIEFEKNEGQTDKFYNYWLGRLHYLQYEFDIAKQHFQAFDQMDVYKTKEIQKETNDYLKKIDYVQNFYLNPTNYEIRPLPGPINSKHDDLSPAFFGGHNELLFVSSRNDDAAQFSIYHAYKNNGEWSTPTTIDKLGKLEKNNAKIEVVNLDGKLFIYDQESTSLNFSEPNANGWETPQAFDANIAQKGIESHFFINDAEDMILFASKTNGHDLDIYYSNKSSSGTWSDPQLIMGDINTAANEDSPFLSHDGQYLYFSSDRAESMGGYDVFRSKFDKSNNQWMSPENMGFPINTIDDEINYQLNEDNISGFLSSDRLHGHGKFDIYYFHKVGKVLATGKVYNQETGAEVSNARVGYRPLKYQDEVFGATTNFSGEYKIELLDEEDYVVEVTINDVVVFTEEVTSASHEHKKAFERNFTVELPGVNTAKTDYTQLYTASRSNNYTTMNTLGSKFRAGQKIILRNIYFDLHSFHLQSESYEVLDELEKILEENPDINIEIEGHTCNIGSHEVNQEVSLRRAQSVKDYLVSKGIPATRLNAKGYGETRPLASNDDEENGRELNRRIELRIQ